MIYVYFLRHRIYKIYVCRLHYEKYCRPITTYSKVLSLNLKYGNFHSDWRICVIIKIIIILFQTFFSKMVWNFFHSVLTFYKFRPGGRFLKLPGLSKCPDSPRCYAGPEILNENHFA